MKSHHFLKQLRHDDIVAAIREAEKKTSGEIRVFISHKKIDDPIPVAQAHFVEMGMAKTQDRNGVLIFVAPRAHKFAIIGDTGVHARCGDDFWRQVADEMTGHFRKSEFSSGIIHGITRAGELLASHFPRHPGDRNQLPDDIEHD